MNKSVTAFTLLLLTSFMSIAPTVAQAGTYKGKCFNQLERDMDSCNVTIDNNNIRVTMKSDSNQTANQVIPGSSIKKVERSKSAKRLGKTAIWTTLAFGPLGLLPLAFKKKQMTYVVEYNDGNQSKGAVFTIQRSQAPLADIDLTNLGKKVVDLDAIQE
ncbi:hypothetical protein IQ247_22315 [Plectonema cf. radiosum LEGE 06105]|uniref:Uncharacterized protein n=1 Tax=Plectonema cf. radiosum LEGE 06105 TaxID=945769 RepID=A0A8J7FCF0_9CYAN|nr:hypothetical protein [Plectonema radiosum]MBE9215364.1 hypothetical protein [Plectonema cf. radiosum LEGE 06105]